jgi:hypothetical protein
MSRLVLNGDDVLGLICSYTIQSASDYVNLARTCKALNDVLKKNIAPLCAGINFNLDRIAAEHRKAEMYTHITLHTVMALDSFRTKSIRFIYRHGSSWGGWWPCGRIPFETTTVIVQGFNNLFEAQMISGIIDRSAIKTLDIVDSHCFWEEAFTSFLSYPIRLEQLELVRVFGCFDESTCRAMLEACPSIKHVYHNGQDLNIGNMFPRVEK